MNFTDDVFVRDLPRQDQLLLETRKNRRIAGQVGTNDLEADRAVNLEIVGLVNRTHAPHAQQCLDFVTPTEHAAHFENGGADGSENLLRGA